VLSRVRKKRAGVEERGRRNMSYRNGTVRLYVWRKKQVKKRTKGEIVRVNENSKQFAI
jgi:hypothetical protein